MDMPQFSWIIYYAPYFFFQLNSGSSVLIWATLALTVLAAIYITAYLFGVKWAEEFWSTFKHFFNTSPGIVSTIMIMVVLFNFFIFHTPIMFLIFKANFYRQLKDNNDPKGTEQEPGQFLSWLWLPQFCSGPIPSPLWASISPTANEGCRMVRCLLTLKIYHELRSLKTLFFSLMLCFLFPNH